MGETCAIDKKLANELMAALEAWEPPDRIEDAVARH